MRGPDAATVCASPRPLARMVGSPGCQAHRQRATGVTRLPPTTLAFTISNGSDTEDGLGQELAKLVKNLKLRGAIESDLYDLHGLRHTFGVEAALAGLTDAQGAARMGH